MTLIPELVITCDRTEIKFDVEYESFNFLDDYIIYLPELDAYLDPTDRFATVGLINWEHTNNHGLFISELNLAGVSSGIGEIKYIDYPNEDKNPKHH